MYLSLKLELPHNSTQGNFQVTAKKQRRERNDHLSTKGPKPKKYFLLATSGPAVLARTHGATSMRDEEEGNDQHHLHKQEVTEKALAASTLLLK